MGVASRVVYRLASLALLLTIAAGGILLFFVAPLHAQSTNASLTGRITDSSKGVVPNALVVVINTGTRIHYETVTNTTGSFYVTDLPPGTYRIEVEKVGFKAVIKPDLVLHVQDALEINFEMVLGSSSESVTVRGGVLPLDTESSTIGTVVEQRKVNELPLNGRNVFNLIELAASVVPQGSSTGTPVGVNPFGWGNYQVNGSFGNESAEFLDGQPLNIGYINLPILIPTQDSIQEFRVQTSNLGPEWGKFSTDIFVANDGMQQYLFHNNGDGTFTECGLKSGVAFTADGKGMSGMGTVFQDYDNDGRPDVLVTVLPREIYSLYHNEGGGNFNYASLEAGLGALTSMSSGWGVGLEDFDNDGWKDLFVAQGHVLDNVQDIDASLRYKEVPLLALNHKGRFERADSGVTKPIAARGLAFGDISNDGYMDAVISCLGGPPVLLLNRGGGTNHWLTISLQGTRSNRDSYGARVSVNGQTRMATSTGSYLCANDKRLHFGLGTAEKATVEILWPSGVKQVLNDVRADQFLSVREPERT